MHEYSIAENIIQLVLEEAKRAKAQKVKLINIVIGELSTVVPECLELYFEPLTKGTILQDTKLNFKNIFAELKCSSCDNKFLKEKNGIECPICGGIGIFTEKGKEFYIESIEIE